MLKDERESLCVTFKMACEKASVESSIQSAILVMNAWADDAFRDKRIRVTKDVEDEIFKLSMLGYYDHSISRKLGLSEPTVRIRVGTMKNKKCSSIIVRGSGD